MSDELIDLMEMILAIHEEYDSEINSFRKRYDFEIIYWMNLKKLIDLLEREFKTVRPFNN
jgi:acyl carrier protein|tara:strand:- start:242 stop:421 length:180 start_codon:yes stop_codon:yes gene_type:complete